MAEHDPKAELSQPTERPASISLERSVIAAVLLIAGVGWIYWSSWQRLGRIWWTDPQYSHGLLVPAFAIGLLWLRRHRVDWSSLESSWWGVAVVVAGVALHYAGVRLYYEWFEHVSVLITLSGVALVAGGWKFLRWSMPAIAFLVFMIPFPYRVEILLSDPLQKLATRASCYTLQTFGFLAVAEGNVIRLEDASLEVVQACNGLRMAVSFLALSVATAIVIQRRIWERVLVVISAVPIALVCNITRISVTGMLHSWMDAESAQLFFHDLSGWLMMPLALGLLALELWLVNFLLFDPDSLRPVLVAGDTKNVRLASQPRPN